MPRPSRGTFRLSTSGWQYAHWRGVFYPEKLATRAWFAHYSGVFDTVEVNNTFYRLPEAPVFAKWREQAPAGFCYALKFSRYGSHIKRLREPADTIGRFLERAGHLGPFLGPVLVQLPPHWTFDHDALAGFLEHVPATLRWAFEFRDPTWLNPEVYSLLRGHGAALCIHDKIPQHPREITADWVYVRFHGAEAGGNYGDATLSRWAGQIRAWQNEGLDCYAYFNNDWMGYAIANALTLRRMASGE